MESWIKRLPDGRHALYLDNTLLSVFKDCELKFRYRHIEHIVPKGAADRTASMWLGSWWSHVMENFYLGMLKYQHSLPGSKEPSEQTCVKAALDAWLSCSMQTIIPADAGTRLPSFQEIYAKVFDKFGGPEGAIKMAVDYWRHFGEGDAKHWKIISAEFAFGLENEVLVEEDNELAVYWCGKPDLIIFESELDNLLPVDHKTEEYLKGNFIQKWKPHSQMAGYVWALNKLCFGLGYDRTVDRCIVNGAARMVVEKPRNDTPRPRFLRPRPHFNTAELAEWQRSVFKKAKRLLQCYLTDDWDRADSYICHLFAGCIYRGLDNQPPGYAREAVKNTAYVQIQPWIPYQKVEEDEETITMP